MDLEIMTPVRLRTFCGQSAAPMDVEERENYWKLIGITGKIIDDKELSEGRVLVLFDRILDDYGIENHNPIANSLWIRKSDLEKISL